MLKSIRYTVYVILVGGMLSLSSCVDNPKAPGREFIPDMGRQIAREMYDTDRTFEGGGVITKEIPEGAIARGKEVYAYPNTNEGYEAAGSENINPYEFEAEYVKRQGKYVFNIYCAVCHGEKGDGQGHLVEIGKFPAPPSFFSEILLNLPEGKKYHTLMYGKGLMGSYASQIGNKDRWLVLEYVKSLQDEYRANN